MTGEELYTKVEFKDVLARRAAHILNPDVCNCGGILELREIGRHGRGPARRHVAAQLQQHHHRARGHLARLGRACRTS